MSCLMMINTSKYTHAAELLQLKKHVVKNQARADPTVAGWQNPLQGPKFPQAVPVPTIAISSQSSMTWV